MNIIKKLYYLLRRVFAWRKPKSQVADIVMRQAYGDVFEKAAHRMRRLWTGTFSPMPLLVGDPRRQKGRRTCSVFR